jgi:hypothetical protein
MDTPVVTTGAPKTELTKPAREARPQAPAARAGTRAGDADAADRAAISARSQAAAARSARPEDLGDSPRVRLGGYDPPTAMADGANQLARETSRQIVLQPAAAARAQANSNAASVLAMLQ